MKTSIAPLSGCLENFFVFGWCLAVCVLGFVFYLVVVLGDLKSDFLEICSKLTSIKHMRFRPETKPF